MVSQPWEGESEGLLWVWGQSWGMEWDRSVINKTNNSSDNRFRHRCVRSRPISISLINIVSWYNINSSSCTWSFRAPLFLILLPLFLYSSFFLSISPFALPFLLVSLQCTLWLLKSPTCLCNIYWVLSMGHLLGTTLRDTLTVFFPKWKRRLFFQHSMDAYHSRAPAEAPFITSYPSVSMFKHTYADEGTCTLKSHPPFHF